MLFFVISLLFLISIIFQTIAIMAKLITQQCLQLKALQLNMVQDIPKYLRSIIRTLFQNIKIQVVPFKMSKNWERRRLFKRIPIQVPEVKIWFYKLCWVLIVNLIA